MLRLENEALLKSIFNGFVLGIDQNTLISKPADRISNLDEN